MSALPQRPVAWVLVSTSHGTMLVNRHDYRAVTGGAYGVGHQLLQTSAFDAGEVDLACALLQLRRKHHGDGVVALDGGANIGVHAVEWARRMHGWGEVLAVEAQERIFYALAGNLAINNCFNARAIWAALGEAEGSLAIPSPDYFTPSSFGSLELRERPGNENIGQAVDYRGGGIKTRVLAIDSLGLARLDFLKLDIEGMEGEALHGARETISRCRPILLVERIKAEPGSLEAQLGGFGYRVLPAGMNLLALHPSDPCAAEVKASG